MDQAESMAMEMMPEDEFLQKITVEEGPLAYYKKNRLAGIYRRVGNPPCGPVRTPVVFRRRTILMSMALDDKNCSYTGSKAGDDNSCTAKAV